MPRSAQQVSQDLAINLRNERLRAGYSQEHLALAACVDRTYVSQIERGVGNPSIGVLAKLAHCLSLDVSELLQRR
ncbi:MAG: helix-turn-helix transcriptional regulator [Betaproteobacteria bacterium]|nr:helix-turn-helix transcriptional regulator [Betaproteobacteria bacterium]